MKKHSPFLAAAAMAVAVAIGAGSAHAQKVLKFASVDRPGMPVGDAIEEGLMPVTAKVSGGKLVIEGHYRGSICGEQKCGEQANQGLIALWRSSTNNFGNFDTSLTIFDLPYLFKDLGSADRLSLGWLGKAQRDEAEKGSGHKVLSVFGTGGFRHFGNTKKPVHVPSDLKGLKVRVTKSPVEFLLFKAWGGTPVPFDWLQTYQGLQTGVVEGLYVPVPFQYMFKMHEVAKYYTETGGIFSAAHLSMDLKQFNALEDDERAALLEGMKAFDKVARTRDLAWTVAETDKLKARIKEWYKPTEDEMKLWRAGAIKAWVEAKGTFDGERAERALAEQGLTDFIAQLEKAGAI